MDYNEFLAVKVDDLASAHMLAKARQDSVDTDRKSRRLNSSH